MLTSIPLDIRWWEYSKKAPKSAYFHQGPLEINKKTKLKYKERRKRIPIMTRKKYVAMRGSNHNIDRKSVVII